MRSVLPPTMYRQRGEAERAGRPDRLAAAFLATALSAVAVLFSAASPDTAFFLWAASPAFAGPPVEVIGEDDRVMLDSGRWPWSAIGRLNRESGGHCSGTLVAADVVLTAAHCLDDIRTHRQVRPAELHFLAGYRRGDYLFHTQAVEIVRPEAKDAGNAPMFERRSRDWALLKLKKRASIPPISVKPLGRDGIGRAAGGRVRVMRAGYGRDRPHLLSLHDGCSVFARPANQSILIHDCDALEGDSGSPILQQTADGPVVVGVTSAVAGNGEHRHGIAVDAAAFETALQRLVQPDAAEDLRPRN